jgi:hypothetical protein
MKVESLQESIFLLTNESSFNQTAIEVFNYQYENNIVYKTYVDLLNRPYPKTVDDIPFLPIEFFKSQTIICGTKPENCLEFLSSATTGSIRSKHFVLDPKIYETSFFLAYKQFIGNPEDQVILALLPNYLEQGNSSLVHMVKRLIELSKNPLSGFVLNQPEEVKKSYDCAIQEGKKVVIFGVSYALLDLAEKQTDLSKATIIETGGMKGRRKELTKLELHQELMKGLNVDFISSEYGMTELLSQAYSLSDGKFHAPAWMKISCRDINDPFSITPFGKTGGINVIDLANLHSCSFIATQDLGKCIDNQTFEILGRFDQSDIRGCNLMVE